MHIDLAGITNRFVRYAQVDTRSDARSTTVPTTVGQKHLADMIRIDMVTLGLVDIEMHDNGYVTATLPANLPAGTPEPDPIGWIAHLDTADFPSAHVKPEVHRSWDGKAIDLPGVPGMKLDPEAFPALKKLVGQTIITTDGTTLLGADDKAGIVGALSAAHYLTLHPNLKHGKIRLAFGPDEEIGRGATRFDVKRFGCKFAYTLDNGDPGDLEYETFNAAQAKIHITGKAVHPGNAKGKMINALTVARRIAAALPESEVPEQTSGYEGFYLLDQLTGSVGSADMTYIIRDFDSAKFNSRCAKLAAIVEKLNAEHAAVAIDLQITNQYTNMGPALEKYPYPLKLAKDAIAASGLTVRTIPFRGGTDGAIITAKGMPTPNLFNGGGNFHGPYEYVSVEGIGKLAETLVNIATLNVTENSK
ncbi:peptidase T [Lacticaseibacillus zhaodongensis]|uniref:peptidase T n=1 Tax=Lacticaseibacillus zhaodongensis TaxID=2668065 RepID=UPI0012D322D1|nr:peptidase T [Lacticaseibacillus zhaodongensis]